MEEENINNTMKERRSNNEEQCRTGEKEGTMIKKKEEEKKKNTSTNRQEEEEEEKSDDRIKENESEKNEEKKENNMKEEDDEFNDNCFTYITSPTSTSGINEEDTDTDEEDEDHTGLDDEEEDEEIRITQDQIRTVIPLSKIDDEENTNTNENVEENIQEKQKKLFTTPPPPAATVSSSSSLLKSKRRSFRITSATHSKSTINLLPKQSTTLKMQRRYSGIQRLLVENEVDMMQGEAYIPTTPYSSEKNDNTLSHAYDHIILKMIAYCDEDITTSFFIDKNGGSIGRLREINTVYIPADKLMAKSQHARIFYLNGRFYLTNKGNENGTYIRLNPVIHTSKPKLSRTKGTRDGMHSRKKSESEINNSNSSRKCTIDTSQKVPNDGLVMNKSPSRNVHSRHWPLLVGSHFRAGHTEFKVIDLKDDILKLEALSGKLSGRVFDIHKHTTSSIGRSTENHIHTGDGELSRRHAIIEYYDGQFYLNDIGSTNGTYMKLTGPYSKPYCLAYGDQLLLAQTSLSVNRYDFGAFANMGVRKAMEDTHCTVQDVGVESLSFLGYGPQSFFGVFDGHGGSETSKFLMDHLHHNIDIELTVSTIKFMMDLAFYVVTFDRTNFPLL